MSSCALSGIFRRNLLTVFRHLEFKKSAAPGFRSTRLLWLVIAVVAMTAASDLIVLGQEAVGPQLERVDVDPPRVGARSRDAGVGQDSGYEDTSPPDRPSSDTPSATGRIGSGSGMPSFSVVTDKSTVSMSSAALPSQVQVVTRQDIERLNVQYYTDLFKQIPGVKAFTQGQGDVGFVISMRGFAGQHGKDIGIFIDGVPQNMPSVAQWVSGSAALPISPG